MINPSANGWIAKYFKEQEIVLDSDAFDYNFYSNIRDTGFIYGHILSFGTQPTLSVSQYSDEENCKLALLTVLYQTYCVTRHNTNQEDFIHKTVAFYKKLVPNNLEILSKLLATAPEKELEKILDERVQTNKDLINRYFSHIITNSLMFLDVLAFHHFLKHDEISIKYTTKFEETIMKTVSLALHSKPENSSEEKLLIKFFESSFRETKFEKVTIYNIEDIKITEFEEKIERYYLLDLVCMVLNIDGEINQEEQYFLYTLAAHLDLEKSWVDAGLTTIADFVKENKSEIQYFKYSHPVKHFYDQTTDNIQLLLKRNKKRLVQEIYESKELMQLLTKSTKEKLSKEEKKKVRKQLLDICKTIPSLTIFLLPGGGLLLPVVLKFIPNLLPSSFNENLES